MHPQAHASFRTWLALHASAGMVQAWSGPGAGMAQRVSMHSQAHASLRLFMSLRVYLSRQSYNRASLLDATLFETHRCCAMSELASGRLNIHAAGFIPSTPGVCKFFASAGGCSRGNACTYAHIVETTGKEQPMTGFGNICRFGWACTRQQCWHEHPDGRKIDGDPGRTPKESSASGSDRPPCRFFMQGVCNKGSACAFMHDAAAAIASCESKNEHGEEGITRVAEDGSVEVNIEQTHIKFGPGMSVLAVTNKALNKVDRISINGLAASMSDADVLAKLVPFGKVQLLRKHETYAFARFDNGPDDAEAAVSSLNGTHRKEWTSTKSLKPGYISVALAAPPGAIITRDSTVRLLWYAPSRLAWAHFHSKETARKAAEKSHDTTLHGRTLSVKFQQPTRFQKDSFSVSIANIAEGTTQNQLRSFLKPRSAGSSGRRGGDKGKVNSRVSPLQDEPFSITFSELPSQTKDAPGVIKRKLESFDLSRCSILALQKNQEG